MSNIYSKACLLFLCTSLTAVHAESVEFLSLSDIHLTTAKHKMTINPKGSVSANNLDLATFNDLMDMMQNELANGLNNSKFVLVTGDLGGHTGNAKTRISYLKEGFSGLYTKLSLPILFIFGNNDSTVAHYGPYTTKLNDLALQNNWVNGFLSSGTLCESSPNTYPCLIEYNTDDGKGYYTAWLAPSLKLVGMNTVPFLQNTKPEYRKGNEELMDWFAQKLKETKPTESVLLAMHANPSTSWNTKPQNYKSQFYKIITDNPGKVIGILSGHTHLSNVSAYMPKSSKQSTAIPLITTGAMATVYGNAPSFNDLILDRKDASSPWAIKNFSTYSWLQKTDTDNLVLRKYYDFNNTYCPGKVNFTVAQCLQANMKNGSLTKSFKDGVYSRRTNGNPNFS